MGLINRGILGSLARGTISRIGQYGGKVVRTATDKKVVDMMLGGTERLSRFMGGAAFRKGYGMVGRSYKWPGPIDPQFSGMHQGFVPPPIPSRGLRMKKIFAGQREALSTFYSSHEGTFEQIAQRGGRIMANTLPGIRAGGTRAARMTAGGARAIAGGRKRRMMLIGAGGAAGFTLGATRASRAALGATPLSQETGTMMYGSGYYSWAKGRGQGMPANHGGTQGLTLAMHRARRR